MQEFLTRYKVRTILSFAFPLIGWWLALALFSAPGADPIGAALVVVPVFLIATIIGFGFAIDARSEQERPKWLTSAALAFNLAVPVGCAAMAVAF